MKTWNEGTREDHAWYNASIRVYRFSCAIADAYYWIRRQLRSLETSFRNRSGY